MIAHALLLLALLAQPAPAPDLTGLTVPATLNGPVREFIAFFQGRARPFYARALARLGRYRGLMVPILQAEGVPEELVFLCMIESGYTADAVSHASAVGPWQFMRATGLAEGLEQDEWVDERRDFEKATRAAAQHLRGLYDRFGSWPLAMAAYNAGVGNVSRAITRANHNDFWRLAAEGELPGEATRYVPKIMAAMVIATDPARYGFSDVIPQAPLEIEVIAAPPQLDLHALAKQIKLDPAALTDLNPELRRAFTPPERQDYPLRVPRAHAEAARAALSAAVKPTTLLKRKIRYGESLDDIARAHGMRRATLERLNEGLERLKPGQEILVFSRARPDPDNQLVIAARPTLDIAIEGRTLAYFPIRSPRPLSEVAAAFGISAGQIALWNELDPQALLQRGMALRLYLPPNFPHDDYLLLSAEQVTLVEPGSDGEARSKRAAKRGRGAHVRIVRHTVALGDNLWKIAKRYGVTVSAIRAENGLNRSGGLVVGAALKIPQPARARPKGQARARKPKPNARGRKRYTIRKGDTLAKIAERFGVEVKAIQRRNGMGRKSRLMPGQTIVIP